jgi:hypothetical protein
MVAFPLVLYQQMKDRYELIPRTSMGTGKKTAGATAGSGRSGEQKVGGSNERKEQRKSLVANAARLPSVADEFEEEDPGE